MSLELLTQLEQKITTSLEALELVNMELDELKAENQQLKQSNEELAKQQQEWEERLAGLLTKFNG